uniref:ditrans,polycis-polyprenyl diphosphate synthase [(2E,6E)-farnesyldiphosphate specific] n=1 Tax=Latimeria chalumnae TaxID=7897 RepID=H3A820_LATCH
MAVVYELLWRLLHALLSWLRLRLCRWNWNRAAAALFLPAAFGFQPPARPRPRACSSSSSRRRRVLLLRWKQEGRALEKLPVHVGLLVAEEEPSYTDIANLVLWCMALGISYVSVYDHQGIFKRNNSRLMEEILKQQQENLSHDCSKYSVEYVNHSNGTTEQQVLFCLSSSFLVQPGNEKITYIQLQSNLALSSKQRENTYAYVSVCVFFSPHPETKNLPDPDLVLKFGPVDSLLGFLPWHIRLTEIISMPSHIDVTYEDFFSALQNYAACEQRLGK